MAMLEFIRKILSRWFESRRKKIAKMSGEIPEEVEKELLIQLKAFAGLSVVAVSEGDYEVGDSIGEMYHMALEARMCSCREFQLLSLPCCHAMADATARGLEFRTLDDEMHKKHGWDRTLVGVILPVQDPTEVETPEGLLELVIRPPKTRHPPERPPKLRIPSGGEDPVRVVIFEHLGHL